MASANKRKEKASTYKVNEMASANKRIKPNIVNGDGQ